MYAMLPVTIDSKIYQLEVAWVRRSSALSGMWICQYKYGSASKVSDTRRKLIIYAIEVRIRVHRVQFVIGRWGRGFHGIWIRVLTVRFVRIRRLISQV